MPVHVRKDSHNAAKPWAIVENATGRIVARSETKAKAEASARARNAAYTKKAK